MILQSRIRSLSKTFPADRGTRLAPSSARRRADSVSLWPNALWTRRRDSTPCGESADTWGLGPASDPPCSGLAGWRNRSARASLSAVQDRGTVPPVSLFVENACRQWRRRVSSFSGLIFHASLAPGFRPPICPEIRRRILSVRWRRVLGNYLRASRGRTANQR